LQWRATISFLAGRLEEKGMVNRQVDQGSRRVRTLVTTAEGHQARQALVDATASRSPVARLSEDEQYQLHRLLLKALGANDAPHRPPAGDRGALAYP